MSTFSDKYIGNRMMVHHRQYNDIVWNVDHNIYDDNTILFCTDTEGNTIQPQLAKRLDNRSLVIQFPVKVNGYASVIKITSVLNARIFNVFNSSVLTVPHRYSHKNFMVQIWDSNNELIHPLNIIRTDKDCRIEFHKNVTAKIYLLSVVSDTINQPASSDWVKSHWTSQEKGNIFLQAADNNNTNIVPSGEKRLDTIIGHTSDNKVEMTWDENHIEGKILAIIHGYRI